ncbi:MAG: amidohydrolase family protein [Lachnospiraceae bacterium]|nr:amidohydrolase family protein [Lachnospiraceae bacterium]
MIDFHTHAFPDKIAGKTIEMLSQKAGIPPHSDGSVEGLRRTLFEAGISLGVVLPVVTRPEQFASVTRFASQLNETEARRNAEGGTKLLSFGGIHPDTADYKKELKELSELGFLGIKLHPDYQGVFFDDIRYLRIIEYAAELGLIIITHAGIDIGVPEPVRCTPKHVKRVLREIKPDKLVLAHCGGWGLWEEVIETLAGESVYMDTAYSMGHISEELFMKLFRTHGTEKLLFATDCPWGNPKKDLETFCSVPLTKAEQDCILYRTAEKLLGMA